MDLEVLGWLADDYEAAHTITADIARALNRPVTEAEVLDALRRLTRAGRAQAFRYDSSTQSYRPITSDQADRAKDAWFMAVGKWEDRTSAIGR